MILDAINNKKIVFKTVLMDSWYVTQRLMALIDNDRKNYYCPLKKNPLVDDIVIFNKNETLFLLKFSYSKKYLSQTQFK